MVFQVPGLLLQRLYQFLKRQSFVLDASVHLYTHLTEECYRFWELIFCSFNMNFGEVNHQAHKIVLPLMADPWLVPLPSCLIQEDCVTLLLKNTKVIVLVLSLSFFYLWKMEKSNKQGLSSGFSVTSFRGSIACGF